MSDPYQRIFLAENDPPVSPDERMPQEDDLDDPSPRTPEEFMRREREERLSPRERAQKLWTEASNAATAELYLDRFYLLKDANRLEGMNRDISWLTKNKTFDQAKAIIDGAYVTHLAKAKEHERAEKAKAKDKSGADLVFKNDKVYVRRINTFAASKLFGLGTRWCITQSPSYFDNYTNDGSVFFFIESRMPEYPPKTPWNKLALHVSPRKEGETLQLDVWVSTDEQVYNNHSSSARTAAIAFFGKWIYTHEVDLSTIDNLVVAKTKKPKAESAHDADDI